MFTGLVETIGRVVSYIEQDSSESGGNGVSITIGDCSSILVDVHLGDSIAINGTCLTVTEFDEQKTFFKVGVSEETLRRTNLGALSADDKVNLERAVTADVRLGGHIVQGHVDTVAVISRTGNDGNALTFTFKLREPEYMSYIVEKGFIALDGTSLTITGVDYATNEFSIMMVSYTQSKVIMPLKEVGSSVNVEVDLTGKLVEKQIELGISGQLQRDDSPLVVLIERLIEKKLAERGL